MPLMIYWVADCFRIVERKMGRDRIRKGILKENLELQIC
jgi:hypothetical protein